MKDPVKWNTIMSAMYGLGVWSFIGACFVFPYFKHTPVEEDDPNSVVRTGKHMQTVVVYKKDFVPYTKRISDYIRSFSSQPGDGDK